ncbi:carbonic anhydrase 6-like [Pollicipes pollicipes]|uniref:carbonic anhydrase 6-like n=1 Tax=Pollicipes pollicipes TaxID=41117 RepID=UPI0018858B31|nr:carbonic anhydrase 6-like [Pollicipes pollicipes]
MQRLLLFCAQLVAGAAGGGDWSFLLSDAPEGQWSYNDSMPAGPSRWAESGYPFCGGKRQSPIDIITCATSQETHPIVLTSFSDTPTSMTLRNIDDVGEWSFEMA